MKKILEVTDLCKTYVINKRQNNVLRNVSFSVNEGEMIAIMGPSGSGKSTLLYTVSGMDNMTSGTVLFGEKDISTLKADELAALSRSGISGCILTDIDGYREDGL